MRVPSSFDVTVQLFDFSDPPPPLIRDRAKRVTRAAYPPQSAAILTPTPPIRGCVLSQCSRRQRGEQNFRGEPGLPRLGSVPEQFRQCPPQAFRRLSGRTSAFSPTRAIPSILLGGFDSQQALASVRFFNQDAGQCAAVRASDYSLRFSFSLFCHSLSPIPLPQRSSSPWAGRGGSRRNDEREPVWVGVAIRLTPWKVGAYSGAYFFPNGRISPD